MLASVRCCSSRSEGVRYIQSAVVKGRVRWGYSAGNVLFAHLDRYIIIVIAAVEAIANADVGSAEGIGIRAALPVADQDAIGGIATGAADRDHLRIIDLQRLYPRITVDTYLDVDPCIKLERLL